MHLLTLLKLELFSLKNVPKILNLEESTHDLLDRNPTFEKTIHKSLMMYHWVYSWKYLYMNLYTSLLMYPLLNYYLFLPFLHMRLDTRNHCKFFQTLTLIDFISSSSLHLNILLIEASKTWLDEVFSQVLLHEVSLFLLDGDSSDDRSSIEIVRLKETAKVDHTPPKNPLDEHYYNILEFILSSFKRWINSLSLLMISSFQDSSWNST